jgi:type IV pilus assembly protein PilM
MNNNLFYKDKPLFGLDIGTSSIKLMQLEPGKSKNKKKSVIGYGSVRYDKSATNEEGIIEQPEIIAKAIKELFDDGLIGSINTRRVAMTIPVAKTYNRVMNLPSMPKGALEEAVRLEAEQYIPVQIDDLYLDFSVTNKTKDNIELLLSAAPKQLIDSYVQLADLLGLEVAAMETTISASGRLVGQAERNDVPTILIDFGSRSVDITIFDKQLIVTGTVPGGGDNFTDLISKKLDVSQQVAYTIKTKYGLGVSKKQKEIQDALSPILDSLTKELKKMIRYYEDRSGGEGKIGQVITMGGGANLPGLSEHLTSELRLPARMCSPWTNLSFGKLQPPNETEKTMFITAAGLALINPKEIWYD